MIVKIIAVNTVYQILTRLITSGVGFLITILIARNFGLLGYGDFTKITALVGLFYLTVDFGLNAFYLQEDEKEKHFFSLLTFRLMLGVFLAIFISLLVLWLPFNQTVKIGVAVFSFSILNQAILLSAAVVFQRNLRYDFLLIATALGSFVSLVLVWLSIYLSLSLFYVLTGFLIGGLITNFTSLIFIKNVLQPIAVDKLFIAKLLKKSAPFGLMLLFNLVYFRIDTILLSLMRSTEEVGIYGLSYKFFDFLIALPLFLSNSVYPYLLVWQKNYRILFSKIEKITYVFLLSSFLIVVIAWIFAPFISLIKKEFLPSVFSFKILLLSLPFFFLTNFFQWVLITLKEQKFLLFVYSFTAILNIILNIIFIPFYGYIASAIITGVSEMIVLLFLALKLLSVQKNLKNVI